MLGRAEPLILVLQMDPSGLPSPLTAAAEKMGGPTLGPLSLGCPGRASLGPFGGCRCGGGAAGPGPGSPRAVGPRGGGANALAAAPLV